MKRTNMKINKLSILLIFLVVSLTSFSGILPFTNRIYTVYQGTPVTVDSANYSMHLQVNPLTGSFVDKRVVNRVGIGVDHSFQQYFDSPMHVKTVLTVSRFNSSLGFIGDTTISLSINYNPFDSTHYNDLSYSNFKNAYKLTVKIDSIYIDGVSNTTLPAHMYIQSDIFVERYANFTGAATAISFTGAPVEISSNCDGHTDAIRLSWPTIAGVEEYQLEWMHVNDYGIGGANIPATGLSYNFKLNSTRISTTNTYYDISTIYDKGYIVYRLRGIGVDPTNPQIPIVGVWNLAETGTVASAGTNNQFYVSSAKVHEKNINWQYSATYAEEGKKKEIVNYYDGSLRNRQSVTKINSDQNAIVGETIYDHQGRPSIQLLPVPVTDPNCSNSENVIQFYPNFNKVDSTKGYSKVDFDLSIENDPCAVEAAAMSSVSGSSQYYSTSNPDQTNQQAYVPDASGYPFTQVEYTPDNTGRIRRQGGVGEGFQLGSGHETEYLYGQPNQLEMDRMFGSEVGDVRHYKKNVVIDANGQASISYLDQEGRVVATALAGESPTNLIALESSVNATQQLQIDAFNTLPNGSSNLNTLTINGDGYEFSTQLTVAYASNYDFNYNFTVEPMQDECLPQFCIDCVYDLTLVVKDECGVEQGNLNLDHKVSGKFTTTANGYVFHGQCANPLSSDSEATLNVYLEPGYYSISKILTINEAALQAYIDMYHDTTKNNCVQTLYDFEQVALAHIDTSNCNLDCASCNERLGTLEEFLAAELGTAADYFSQKEDCDKLCNINTVSSCETALNLLLMDVSPDGQYAEHTSTVTGVFDPSSYPLTVLNESNSLPISTANWRNPKYTDAYGQHVGYINSLNEPATVELQQTSSGWTPMVVNTALITFDSENSVYVTAPENLLNVEDFVSLFEASWAKSLVEYHPEYCYYTECLKYESKINESDGYTSETFDQLLKNTSTFQGAIDNNLIATNQTLYDWFTIPSGFARPWDPFVVYSSSFESTECNGIADQLMDRFVNYKVINGVTYSMPEVAAMMVRCQSTYGQTPTASCIAFGTGSNTQVLDAEWMQLKSYYLSMKQTIQREIADCQAINVCPSYNGCIGDDGYNPFAEGMISLSAPFATFNQSALFDSQQPCNVVHASLYLTKQRRFIQEDDIPVADPNEAAYQLYLQTGLCPIAFQAQYFIDKMASEGKLDNTGFSLNAYSEFTNLWNANNDYNFVGPIPQLNYNSTANSTSITSTWVDSGSNVYVNFSLLKPTSPAINWDAIYSFSNFTPTGGGNFSVDGTYLNAGIPTVIAITGSFGNFNLMSCSFEPSCHPNGLASDLDILFNATLAAGVLMNTSPEPINPLVYGSVNLDNLVTSTIINAGGVGSSLSWLFDWSTNSFRIVDASSSLDDGLRMNIVSSNPAPYNYNDLLNALYFEPIVPLPNGSFKLTAVMPSGQKVVLNCNIEKVLNSNQFFQVQLGDCGLPAPVACQGVEYELVNDLSNILEDLIVHRPFDGNSMNFYSSYLLPNRLENYLPIGLNSTTSDYAQNVTTTSFEDKLTIEFKESCIIKLGHADNAMPELPMDSIVEFLSAKVDTVGGASANGYYYNFIIEAQYKINNSFFVDYLYGSTSCIPLKPCNPCAESAITLLDTSSYNALRSFRVQQGYLQEDPTLVAYKDYTNIIDGFNSRFGLDSLDSNFVYPISYREFASYGIKLPLEGYLKYINNFYFEFDQFNFILDPSAYIGEYGYGTNNDFEYKRYLNAIEVYNNRAINLNLASLNPITDAQFYAWRLADTNYVYINYLQELPNGSTGQTALSIDAYFAFNGSYPTTPQGTLYTQYLVAYQQFVANQTISEGCGDYAYYSPLYSYQTIADNNLFCSAEGMTLFTSYISSFYDTTNCPKDLPKLDSCSGIIAEVDSLTNQKLYMLYERSIKAFNLSAWAEANSFKLESDFMSFEEFMRVGRSGCILNYNNYLKTYIHALPSQVLSMPLSFNKYNFCPDTITFKVTDPCLLAYHDYLECVNNYNNWAIKFNSDQVLKDKIDKKAFLYFDLCNCVDELCSRLNEIMNGTLVLSNDGFNQYTSLFDICKQTTHPPCSPAISSAEPVVSPSIEIVNDCVEMAIQQALYEAQLNYANYVDSVNTELAAKYKAHCLSVHETMVYKYDDKMYHYTLYYYDQAGNLIKTVPPGGVDLLEIGSSSDLLSEQIQNDRTNGTKTVFTSHRLVTRYEYNSLNQLVFQYTPDADPMNIFEVQLPNGLHASLVTTQIQMVTSNRGYLSGYIGNRGYLYRTDDGGNTWSKVNNLVSADLKKVHFFDALNGIAIGEAGVVVKTIDGGSSWDMVSTYNIGGNGMIKDLNDLAFISTGSGNYEGYIVGEKGTVIKTIFNGTSYTFTNFATGLPTTGGIVSNSYRSITADASSFYLLLTDISTTDFKSNMFTIGLSDTTWTAENQVQATDLFDVAYYATNAAYASGKDGRIYQNTAITSATSSWKLLPNNLKSKVSEIGFFDAQNGIALVDESGVKHLYRTFDGAKSWTMVSSEPFNELSMSSDRSLGLAVGNLGHVEVVVAGSSINIENIVLPFINQTSNFSAGWIARKSATEVYAMLAKTDGTIYSSSNILVQYPVWNTTTASTLLGGSPIQQIEGKLFSDTKVVSVVRTVSNKLVLLSKPSNSLLYAYSTLNLTSGDLFGGIAFDDVSGKVYTYNTASYKLGSIAISGGSLPTSITYSSATLTGNPIYTYLDVQGAGTSGTMIGIGASGLVSAIQFTSSSLAVNTQDNQTLRMTPIDLKTVDYLATSGQVLAAGADGQVYVRAITGGTVWKALSTSRNTTLNDLKQAGTSLFAVGSDGVILFGSYTIGTQSTSLNEVTLSNGQLVSAQNQTKTFHSVAVSGNKVYAVGTSGIVAYSPDYTTTGFGISYQGNQDLYSIAQLPSSSAHYAVGVNARINSIQGGSFMKVNEIYTPIARDVHFMNTNTGTYLSDGYTLRSSNDGGVTWEIITPTNSNAAAVTLVQNRVWTLSPTVRLSFGANMNTRIFNASSTDFLVSSVPSISAVSGNGLSLIVAGSNKVARLNFTPGFLMTVVALPVVGSSVVINGAYQFENSSYALVGNGGYFEYYNSTGTLITSSSTGVTEDLYDLDFYDRSTGVLVGADGTYLRTKNQVMDANGYITSTSWMQQGGVGTVGVDPYDVQSLTDIDIYSIAFINATEGIYGGEYQSGYINYSAPTHCFVRKCTDSYGRYTARFFYDKLGRLVVSQNSRQYNASATNTPRKFSYTLYDALGRVIEVGEKSENSTSVAHFKSVFGTTVSNYFNPSVIDDVALLAWVEGDGARKEVTKSYYDSTVIIGLPGTFDVSEETQRKRITHVTYEAEYDGDDQTYDHATHYNYDIHGNVKNMLQDNRKMAMDFTSLDGQRFKRLDYRYDLVSGNVHRMSVQSDSVDQWHHSYEYDADNRITNAYTNKNTPLLPIDASTASLNAELIANGDWEKDARYHYYEHGPLARVEIGNEQLQGVDYVYNLQGWMKGVNSSILDPAADPGKDGPSTGSGTGTSTGSGTANSTFAPDIVGFSLHYFDNDYAAIGGIGNAATIAAGSHAEGNSAALYNGNIRYMQTAITDATITSGSTQNYAAMPMLNAYQYDQLNRLKAARSYETGLASGVWNPTSYSNSYLNTFIYDAMGNIEYQDRYNRAGVQLEKMDYQYHETSGGDKISNRLYHINDLIDSLIASNDIDDQYAFTPHSTTTNINGSNNYVYDEEGRLIKDKAEEISNIVWRVDGKVKEINRPSTSTKKKLKFDYDAMGNRIAKHVFDNQTGLLERSTYYILDAQGNQLTTYEHVVDNSTANFVLKERHIFGSSRLGMLNEDVNVLTAQIEQNVQHEVGKKYYELSNHLGNVLSVFTDLKIPQSSNTVTVSSYRVFIAGTTDYSPFGVELDGRTQSPEAYRYVFQGQESDDEIKGDGNSVNYKYRMCDPRLGRFFAVDPLTQSYPELTPYQFSSNSVIFMVELEGMEGRVYYHNFNEKIGKANPKPGFSKEVEGLTENVAFTIHYKTNGDFDYAEGRGTESGARPTFHSYGEMTNDKLLLLNFPNQDKVPAYLNQYEFDRSDPTYYDPWEGNDHGVVPFDQGMKIMGGTVSVILTGGTIALAGEVSILSGLSMASGVDDISTQVDGSSLMSKSMGISPENLDKLKLGVSLASFSTGTRNLIKEFSKASGTKIPWSNEEAIDLMNIINDELSSTAGTMDQLKPKK